MTLELFFVGGSFVVGVAQIVESVILIRDHGRLQRTHAIIGSVEFAWTLFCAHLLVTGRLEFARWLAIMFVAPMVIATIVAVPVGFYMGKHAPPDAPDFTIPLGYAWAGIVFGTAFAAAALFLLAT